MTPMLNPEFATKVFEGIAKTDEIFRNFANSDCGCVARFGYCSCTYLERACRFVSNQASGEFFNQEQREILISQTLYQSEGSYSTEQVEKMNDVDLASAWIETASDYVQSQL
jgi:hypothetical protein